MINFEALNEKVRETLDKYYRNHDAESFFTLCDILEFCKKHKLEKSQVPALIEMQNVIVMG